MEDIEYMSNYDDNEFKEIIESETGSGDASEKKDEQNHGSGDPEASAWTACREPLTARTMQVFRWESSASASAVSRI